ncbi:apical sushi protein [Plasmodium gonderi]|uniref:Apical sushi protein n=1 Tax=Plasmodium gonderi TaxID=77519 RepID=A0A1Y1J9R9_PLAGO|nr:apical sushi protein [Plasmodium gonderi]GAW79239.1 apical sushi protein [Plasmodium gonderi]
MKLVRGIIITYLLCYNIELKAKQMKRNYSFLGRLSKLESIWEGGTPIEGFHVKDDPGEGEISQGMNETNNVVEGDEHPNLRSNFSFIQGKGREEIELAERKNSEWNKEKNNSLSNHQREIKFVHDNTHIATEEIMKEGENFYINGGTADYEYNNDEEFFKAFHTKKDNKEIIIHSPCFDIQDVNSCRSNKNCFYDNLYHTCFQNCKILDESECSKYTECKITNNGCENEGYLNIQVFDADIGKDVRACELFDTEGSCYMMEELYKNFGNEKKTNFNCAWLSYKHEFKKHKEDGIGKGYKKEKEKKKNNEIINVAEADTQNGHTDHFNYHVLRNDGIRDIGRDEKFLSLLQIKLNEKKNKKQKDSSVGKNNKNKSAKKGNTNRDDDSDNEDDDNLDEIDEEEDLDINNMNDEEDQEKGDDLDNDTEDDNEDDNFLEKSEKKKGGNKGKGNNHQNNSIEGSTTLEKSESGQRKPKDDAIIYEGKEDVTDQSETYGNVVKADDEQVQQEKIIPSQMEIVTESIIDDTNSIDKHNNNDDNNDDNSNSNNNRSNNSNSNSETDFRTDKNNEHIKDNREGFLPAKRNMSNVQNEKEILRHNFNSNDQDEHSQGENYDEWIRVETHICANLNERPNPSTLLEGALIAEKEAELRSIKKKYKVTDDEICVKPSNELHASFTPSKNFYVLGEKIEFKCQNGYKIVGTTNVGVCVGRNTIIPNISCQSLNDFDDVQKVNIQKIDSLINSCISHGLSMFVVSIVLVGSYFLAL